MYVLSISQTECGRKLQIIDGRMRVRMIIIIWKQWKTRAKRVWGLRKLGIQTKQAILMARMNNRYMIVAHNPTIKQAITKERLTKRGLISLSDYYAKVHIQV